MVREKLYVHMDIKMDLCRCTRLHDTLLACNIDNGPAKCFGVAALKITGGTFIREIGNDEDATANFLLYSSNQVLKWMLLVDTNSYAASVSNNGLDGFKSLVVFPIYPLLILIAVLLALNWHNDKYF